MDARQAICAVYNGTSKIVKHYSIDYLTDAYSLGEYCASKKTCNMPFIHIARNSGTHLIILGTIADYPDNDAKIPYLFGHADRYTILDQVDSALYYCKKEFTEFDISYYDGNDVCPIDYNRACTIMADYKASILSQWKEKTE